MDSTRAWIVELQTLGEAPLPPVAESVRRSDDEAAREASDGSVPVTEAPSGRLAFVRDAKGRFHPEKQIQIKNSLLAAVGFLELANASDFAANVWNLDPMPTYVLVLMAIGAVCALGMLYFVVRDAMLSCTTTATSGPSAATCTHSNSTTVTTPRCCAPSTPFSTSTSR